MSYGLQVFKADGSLMFGLENRLSRLITTGSYSIAAGEATTIYIDGIVNDGTWGAVLAPTSSRVPSLTINTGNLYLNNIIWSSASSGIYIVFRL